MKKLNYIIPKEDIKQLEQARKYLHKILNKYSIVYPSIVFNVSDKMYRITHKKYQQI